MKKKLTLFLLSSILLLSSCAITTSSELVVKTTPKWVTDKTQSQTLLKYVIIENGVDEEDSYKNASDSFVDFITTYLSIPQKSDEYKESLYSTLKIADFDIYNSARFYENKENGVKGYFLFTANKSKVNDKFLERTNIINLATLEVENLEITAMNYYKKNKDFLALSSLVDAYIVSRENNIVTKGINPDAILQKCLLVLNKAGIEVSNFDSENLECTFEVIRQVGLFPPNISEPKLKISYSALNSQSNNYITTERIKLSSKINRYDFTPQNLSAVPNGVLLFENDIDEILFKLEKKGFYDAAKVLENSNKSYLVSYNKVSSLNGKSIKLSVYENDLNDVAVSIMDVSRIVDSLTSLGAFVNLDIESDDQDESNLADRTIYDYQITLKNEVIEKLNDFMNVVKTTGSVEVADLKKGIIVYASEPFDSVSNGDSEKIALKNAFDNFALKSIFLIKENF